MADATQPLAPLALLDVAVARERILSLVGPLPPERVPVSDALGRGLGQDVLAVRTLPPWNNSAVDGYAVHAASLGPGTVQLRVRETVHAGEEPTFALGGGSGDCVRVMTGAPVPQGTDAVVMQEDVTVLAPDLVQLDVRKGSAGFVRKAGEDATKGALLLPRGTALGISEGALLWAQGLMDVLVPRAPRVGILSTGDELVELGGSIPADRLVDTNGPALEAAVRRAGGIPVRLGIAQDTLRSVLEKLEAAQALDVVLTSAGVSVGERDFVRPALEALGARMSFWRVAVKPGKPLAAGMLGETLVLGLPGNPTSSLVSFELFVRPALRRLVGRTDTGPARVAGRLAGELKKPAGLTHYVRAACTFREGALWAEPLKTQTSGALRSAALATHLLEIPKDTTFLPAGALVELLPVSWAA
jgi:molybdopterin molybdotransferase